MEDKVYWKGLEELEQPSQQNDREFADELPVLGSIMEPITTKGTTSRRDFLKMLGFSTTAAVVAAGCEMPVRKSIPYAFKPEEVTPGIANYYASATYQGGDYAAVLVKTREGRPIKIEGNSLSTVSQGGTSSRAQAAVLSLYDGGRYRNPMRGKENITWETADKEIGEKLKAVKDAGGKIVIYSATIPSPSTLAAIEEFKKAYGADHLVSDAVSYSGILAANGGAIPAYHFDKAKVIVGIGCDFLGTWLSPIEFAKDWSKNRKLNGKKEMSRHIQVESALTVTGSAADKRYVVKPSEEATFAVDLLKAVESGASGNKKADAVAKELVAAKGTALVVSGSNDPNVQTVVNAINKALDSYGATISDTQTYNTKKGSDKAAADLVAGLDGGTIKAVIFYNSNPLLTHPQAAKLKDAIKKAAVSVSFSEVADETSEACAYVCPDNHWLESWNDVSPKTGVYNITQPTITKLFNTRQAQETLLTWAGNNTNFYDYVRAYWDKNLSGKQSKFTGFNALWDVTVHDGELVLEGDKASVGTWAGSYSATAADAASAVTAAYGNLGDSQLKIYESVAIGDGTWAGNPFQQENPDPITKITWGNVVLTSVNFRRANKIKNDLELKDYQLVKVTANGQSVTLPAVAVPGLADGTFAIAVGYGKTVTNGAAGDDLKVGKNVYPLMGMMGDNYSFVAKATVEVLNQEEKVAITQSHHNIVLKDLGGIKKRKLVKETTLPEYLKSPDAGNEDRKEILEELVTLYYKHEYPGHHWKMNIDLNSCIGCGACVTACNIENNVPVVGKDQVIRSREMHWMRIDRYFTFNVLEQDATDPTDSETKNGQKPLPSEDIDVVFQPMLCQQCDNAPCENVCPVAATTHSSEGLNQMTYNRCIGTRYCANNCPYKVRRFNWYDYQAADSFDGKRVGKMWANEGLLSDVTNSMHEPLARMVLNPDVTVRSRGVIEKCSFCVQRTQEGKLAAKKENRPLKDGEVKSACQTACPTDAIVFGDGNNKESVVAERLRDPRTFGVIEEIHTMPNVTYLTKVRNREEEAKAATKEA
ncbi:MAG: TAT-variant-translocated molybdopterin oxidoreductase [Bacteroidetes bacterium]|nr:TAT-variant-translocated molybdopterin oxidoreductase [Bacteroidota bacterium]